MIHGNGSNPGSESVAEALPDPSSTSAAQGEAGAPPDLATRGRQRAKRQLHQNRFVIIGAGALVVALLLFVMVSMPRGKPATTTRGSMAPKLGGIQQNEASHPERSLLPITDSGRPTAEETHAGVLGEDDLQRTATRKPTPARPLPSPQSALGNTLASIPPFPEEWQAPPYKSRDDRNPQPPDLNKAERHALDVSSVVYARAVHPTQGSSLLKNTLADPEPEMELGLATGSRLRARLESAVSTAVRMPVLAVIEYNYEREGEIIVPAGAKAVGHVQQADHSGYLTIQFDSLMMPDGAAVPIQGVATDLNLRPPKGRVEGKNTGKNVLLRSLSGIGQMGALLAGRGNLNRPLSEGDMLRERVSNNIGEASDEQLSRLVLTEHVVVTIPADTSIYVVLEHTARSSNASTNPSSGDCRPLNSTSVDELRQLLQLQREFQTAKTDQ
ncbi:MAG TPA: hypothetical protein VKD23_21800 [Terriglobales bacterium]|nr:hypothetical protein [Terriglobales bacterium]